MALSKDEKDIINNVDISVAAGVPVSKEDQQMILNLVRREGVVMSKMAFLEAKKRGLNVEGIKVKD